MSAMERCQELVPGLNDPTRVHRVGMQRVHACPQEPEIFFDGHILDERRPFEPTLQIGDFQACCLALGGATLNSTAFAVNTVVCDHAVAALETHRARGEIEETVADDGSSR